MLIKIKEYLEDNLGFDFYSMQKLKISPIIAIGIEKARHNSKPMGTFMIKNLHVWNNYLIPFLDKEFLTKKGKDFNDFKIFKIHTLCVFIVPAGGGLRLSAFAS